MVSFSSGFARNLKKGIYSLDSDSRLLKDLANYSWSDLDDAKIGDKMYRLSHSGYKEVRDSRDYVIGQGNVIMILDHEDSRKSFFVALVPDVVKPKPFYNLREMENRAVPVDRFLPFDAIGDYMSRIDRQGKTKENMSRLDEVITRYPHYRIDGVIDDMTSLPVVDLG